MKSKKKKSATFVQIILKKVNEPKIYLPVLKQAVVRVKHLMRKKVEPLPGYASVVQAFFSLELEHQALSHVFRSQLHNLKKIIDIRYNGSISEKPCTI